MAEQQKIPGLNKRRWTRSPCHYFFSIWNLQGDYESVSEKEALLNDGSQKKQKFDILRNGGQVQAAATEHVYMGT